MREGSDHGEKRGRIYFSRTTRKQIIDASPFRSFSVPFRSAGIAVPCGLSTGAVSWGWMSGPERAGAQRRGGKVTFNELIRLLEANGFALVRQKGSVRYYGKAGWPRLVRVDYHGAKQVRTGTCHAILTAAGIPKP